MPTANLESNDYYENLGLDRNATTAQIKSAYRKLAIQYHPDKNLHDKESAEKNFKIVGEAYNVLINKETRTTYDIYGKEGLADGVEPFTKETALRIFHEFFRFGEAMDPEAPERAKGIRRAAGGIVYAPVKGIVYGGRSVLMGVALSSTAVALGAKNMIQSVTTGFREMGEAGVYVAKQRRRDTDTGADHEHKTEDTEPQKNPPSFMGGLKKATVGAISAPVAAFVSGGSVLLASGVAASGFIVGGFAGAASNVASGVCEVQAANKIAKAQKKIRHEEKISISSSDV